MTAAEALIGFLAGSLLGLILGIVIVVFPTLERIVYPYVVALQTVPKVAIAPLMVVWFGFGLTSKVLVVALVSLFPVLVNVDRRACAPSTRTGSTCWARSPRRDGRCSATCAFRTRCRSSSRA